MFDARSGDEDHPEDEGDEEDSGPQVRLLEDKDRRQGGQETGEKDELPAPARRRGGGEITGENQDHGELGEFGGLDGEGPQLDPTPGAETDLPQDRDQEKEREDRSVDDIGGGREPPVIGQREEEEEEDADEEPGDLALDKIHPGALAELIGGAVDGEEPDRRERGQRADQPPIKVFQEDGTYQVFHVIFRDRSFLNGA